MKRFVWNRTPQHCEKQKRNHREYERGRKKRLRAKLNCIADLLKQNLDFQVTDQVIFEYAYKFIQQIDRPLTSKIMEFLSLHYDEIRPIFSIEPLTLETITKEVEARYPGWAEQIMFSYESEKQNNNNDVLQTSFTTGGVVEGKNDTNMQNIDNDIRYINSDFQNFIKILKENNLNQDNFNDKR